MSAGGSYYAGTGVRVSAAFTDINGAAVDPTTVTLKYQSPGVATTWTYGGAGSIVKDSIGNYHAILDTTALPGVWAYEWQGTGAVLAVSGVNFNVLADLI
jgi:hypothetical protein